MVLITEKTAPSAARATDLFQVIGERNSGTTWLHKLVADNVAPDMLQPTYLNQWKHATITAAQVAASSFAHRTIFIVCVKSPLAWAVSMYSNPFHSTTPKDQHRQHNFSAFLARPWETKHTILYKHHHVDDDHDPGSRGKVAGGGGGGGGGLRSGGGSGDGGAGEASETDSPEEIHEWYQSLAALRADKLSNHLNLSLLVPRVHVVRYEDVLASPAATVEAILTAHGIPPARGTFVVSTTNFVASGSAGSTTKQFDRHAWYTKQHFLRAFDRAAYDAYVPLLDMAIEARAGYGVPSWAETEAAVVAGRR